MARVKVPYFKWRDGRPRWEPGPGLRARGYAGKDLRDGEGKWLGWGAALEECKRLNAQIADKSAPVSADTAVRNWNNLITLYKASPNFLRLKPSTQANYANHCDIIAAWCGDQLVITTTKANIANWHMAQEKLRGAAMANAIFRTLRILSYYAMDDLDWIGKVRTRKIRQAETEGRLVAWSMEAVTAFVTIADFIGQPDMGDACLLGCLTGQSRKDLLLLPRGDISGGLYRFTKRLRRAKTGREVKVPLVTQLGARIAMARRRADQRFPNITHTTELVDVETGLAFHPGGKHFERRFRQVRMFAAGAFDKIEGGLDAIGPLPDGWRDLPFCPDLLGFKFQDLRDTAVTWLFLAGCTEVEIATITGHSLATVRAILDKHYLVREDTFAIEGGKKLEAFLKAANF